MPVQPAEHWDEKAKHAEDLAEAMRHSPSKESMLEIAKLYRQLAAETRKLQGDPDKIP
ncbi:MAG: hypothetical protein WDN25_13510 [Acetobacteraceae bacterium]